MRIAAIDIGTNSTHLVVASASPPAGFEVVDRARDVVQLGRGSFATGRLDPEAVARTLESLARFAQLASRLEVQTILCVATAAVREARNGARFLRAAREALGFMPRVIPAEEEGRLIYLAVRNALQLDDEPAAILDIGGGSAQIAIGTRDRCHQVVSAPLGALRLTETLLQGDPPPRADVDRLRDHVADSVAGLLANVALPATPRVYGSSGSIHALAQLVHWSEHGGPLTHVNGHVVPTAALEEQSKRLARMSLAEREKLQGLDARRAEIIVPGAIVLVEILQRIGADGIVLSDFGLREGLILDYLAAHAREISEMEGASDLRLASVLGLARKFDADSAHARHVTELALSLFDQLADVHHLGTRERDLLAFAGHLHDVGTAVGYDDHARHSHYIIRHGKLRGLSGTDVEIVANVARYHGKRRPKKRDEDLHRLAKADRKVVRWLSAFLRIAEALDRSHYQLVREVRVVRRPGAIALAVPARPDIQLELWAARARTDALEKLLDARVRVVVDGASRAREAWAAKSGPAGQASGPDPPRPPRAAPPARRTAAERRASSRRGDRSSGEERPREG